MAGESDGLPVVVTLPEDIDFTNSDDTAASLLAARGTPGLTIADMTATMFCDSMGMRMLLVASDGIAAAGSTLRVVISPAGSVAQMMAILGLGRLLLLHHTVQDAITAHGTDPDVSQPTAAETPKAPAQLRARASDLVKRQGE